VEDEHFCYFDDMYSPEYSLQWIYEDIMKYDIGQESRKFLEEGHKEILQSECYQEYGYPFYINNGLDMKQNHVYELLSRSVDYLMPRGAE